MTPDIALCDFGSPTWLIFGDQSDILTTPVLWAHFTALFFSLSLAIFVLVKNKNGLANRILFATLIAFFMWTINSLINTPANRGDIIMFTWSMCILMEPIVYGGSLYLLYVLIDKKDMAFNSKLLFGLLYLPVILLLPTTMTLPGFNVPTCLANEGPIATYYVYLFEIFILFWIIVFAVRRYIAAVDTQKKQEVLALTLGTILFLVAFSWGNIVGSFTDNWELGTYGLFGVPIFTSFFIYSIVKYKTFDIKILASVALILALMVLMFVGLFV